MNKKELNNNEVEKISGGTNNQPIIKFKPKIHDVDKLLYPIINNGPVRHEKKILEIIKKEQNKDKEKPEKGKLSE